MWIVFVELFENTLASIILMCRFLIRKLRDICNAMT